jgi:hypothetical protein
MNKSKIVSRIALAAGALLALCCVHQARAGTKGSFIQPNGTGKSSVNLSWTNSGQVATAVATNYTYGINWPLPCSGVNPLTWYVNSSLTMTNSRGVLPTIGGIQPASTNYIQNKGTSIGTWTNSHYITGGVGVDNPDFDKRLLILPTPCSSFSMDSTMVTNNDGLSGVITIEAHSDAGSGLWVRGVEYAGPTLLSADDIVALGKLKFDYIVGGPFDFRKDNCTALIIPFTTETGITNFYFLLDTVGHSIPFTLICPPDQVLACDATSSSAYLPVQVTGGCGDLTLTYSPPASAIQFGVTSQVTATATASDGSQATCTFNATRGGLTFVGFSSPLSGPVGTCTAPAKSIKQGSNTPIKFDTKCGSSFYTGGPTPRIQVQAIDPATCLPTNTPINALATLQANDWHFNWNATNALGTYKVIAILQDGTTNFTYVAITK